MPDTSAVGTSARIFVAGADINRNGVRCKVCNGELVERQGATEGRVWLECPSGHYSKNVSTNPHHKDRARTQFGAGQRVIPWV